MRRSIGVLLMVLLIAAAMPMGCVKETGSAGTPNVTNFAIESVAPWKAGMPVVVTVSSTTLADGSYIVNSELTGANKRVLPNTALVMAGGRGTFTLNDVNNDDGETTIIVHSLINTNGITATLTSGNTYTFSDSTGVMAGTIAGAGFRATHVTAEWPTGGTLSIAATRWTPLATITLYLDHFNGLPGTMNFTQVSDFNGGASYSFATGSEFGKNGSVTINTVSPLYTGTYTFTCEDNTVISGSFSCPAP